MTKSTINRRHTRHSKLSRLRHAREGRSSLGSWLNRQVTNLDTTADLTAFTANAAVAATGSLTITSAANDDTVTIGNQIYTFKTTLTGADGEPNEVLIGASADESRDNLIAAINNAAGEGTTYGSGTIVNENVSAASGGAGIVDVTAKTSGEAANSVVTTETGASLAWGAATLTGGVDTALTAVTHGLELNDGPFSLSNSGGALPAGLSDTETYFVVEVVDSDNFKISVERDSVIAQATDIGTGTHSYARCDDQQECVFELLKSNTSQRIANASDIDDLD